MRVISGTSRGRKLVPLKGLKVRPTSDRAREAVFNILGSRVRNAHVLDLFAGTGALGIEALSRGAASAFFMDKDCATVRKNIEICRFSNVSKIFEQDLIGSDFPPDVLNKTFDIIFMDPPYGEKLIETVLKKSHFLELLAPDAVIFAEHGHKENIAIPVHGLDISRQKKYSKTKISIINQFQ